MKLKPFFLRLFLSLSILVLIDHLVLKFFFSINQKSFVLHYPLVLGTFIFSSIVVCGISYYLYQKNFDIIGYVFLFLTTLKMGVFFFIGKPLLLHKNVLEFEKIHFFILFFLFLILETYWTIFLLNKPLNPQRGNS